MEHYLAEQYLTRIGYVSGPEHSIQEPDPRTRSKIRPATIVEVQPTINPLEGQYAAQILAPSAISSRPATQIGRPELLGEASSASILSENPSTTSTPVTEASDQALESRQKPVFPSPPPPPPPQIPIDILANLHSELERRQKSCLGIERQIEACQKDIQSLPSRQKKVAEEHEKRIAQLVKPENDKRQKRVATEKRRDPQTAEEAKSEEMRDIYMQYDCKSVGAPPAKLVDAFFGIIADTEHHAKKAEDANKAAKRQEVKLEEKLYLARCAVFEMECEIEGVKNGEKNGAPEMEGNCRMGAKKEGKKKRRRGKGGKHRR